MKIIGDSSSFQGLIEFCTKNIWYCDFFRFFLDWENFNDFFSLCFEGLFRWAL